MSARQEVMASIKRSLADVPREESPAKVDVPLGPLPADPVAVFVERVEEYRGRVRNVAPDDVADEVAEVCRSLGVRSLVVPPGLPPGWLPDAGEVELIPYARMDAKDLDRIGGALTGARLAIAETGTLVLDGDRISGKRAITLVPDVHICVISRHQVVPSVPDAIAQLGQLIQRRLPMIFVSGPSATSDIEFNRVEGVHGPRTLVILLV